MMAAGSPPDNQARSLEAYHPSEYAEASWPRIEVDPVDSTFRPATFEVVAQTVFATDPMFADFGVEIPVSPEEPALPSFFVSDSAQGVIESSNENISEEDSNRPEQAGFHATDEGHQQEPKTYVDIPNIDENPEFLSQRVTEELEPSEEPDNEAIDSKAHDEALAAAREEGYAQGVAVTKQEFDATYAEIREHFSELAEDFKTQSQEMLQEYERKAVDLALLVARRMVGTVVETQREYVVSVIREAMQSLGSATIEAIRVSPADFDFLVNQGASAQLKTGSDSPPVFASDETIKAGCIIKTSSGEVDFDLEAAWNRLHSKMVQGPQS